ncbi:MAG: ChbG/HpnK family deacetylase [Hyphomicrobiaceae bacterium]
MSEPDQRQRARPRIVVCADDYGFTPGVSRGIREALGAGAISATSVMTVSEYWPEEAAALRSVAGAADIGLHVTLTDQRPLGPMPTFAPSGRFPPLTAVFRDGLLRRLPLDEIEAEIERQLAAFVTHYGVPPAHIDGHHHMHQLPGVRDIVVRAAARVGGGRTWVRSCREAPRRILSRGVAPQKALVLSALGPVIERRAASLGVATNHGFAGAYDFVAERRPIAELFARFIAGSRHNGLVMCHPGHADAVLAGRDAMTTAREAELAFLTSNAWPALLEANGLEVGPLLIGQGDEAAREAPLK